MRQTHKEDLGVKKKNLCYICWCTKDIWTYTMTRAVVDIVKIVHWWVNCTFGAKNVWRCKIKYFNEIFSQWSKTFYKKIFMGCPRELLFADDSAIISDSLEVLMSRLKKWKASFKKYQMWFNVGKISFKLAS